MGKIVSLQYFVILTLIGCGQIKAPEGGSNQSAAPLGSEETILEENDPVILPPVQNANVIPVSNSNELQTAIGAMKAGDIIELSSNSYQNLNIQNKNLNDMAEIRVAPGATANFKTIMISNSSNIRINGLRIRPDFGERRAVELDGTRLVFENSDISYSDDPSGWSASDWVNRTGTAIGFSGNEIQILNNTITNVDFGITGTASYSLVRGNSIDGFAGDGMRPLGDHSVWEDNRITNNFNVDSNHDDGIQTWSRGPNGPGSGTQVGLVIRGNTIIESTSPNKPFPGSLQGIGFFDGMFKDFIIEDNLVIVNQWHGIAVYGAENVTIRYNTVIDLVPNANGIPWIKINDHKNGTKPINSRVEYNISTRYSSEPEVTESNNAQVSPADYDTHFVSPQTFDFRLKSTAPIQNQGVRY